MKRTATPALRRGTAEAAPAREDDSLQAGVIGVVAFASLAGQMYCAVHTAPEWRIHHMHGYTA